MLFECSKKHNARPLKSQFSVKPVQKYTISTCIDVLKSYTSKLENHEPYKILIELERLYHMELDYSKENTSQIPLQQKLECNRLAFNQLYDKYTKDTAMLQKEVIAAKAAFPAELHEKHKEIEKLHHEIKNLKKQIHDAHDYREIIKQCQALEESMLLISKKCDRYQEKIQNQDNIISKLSQENLKLSIDNKGLQQRVMIAEEKSSTFINSFEKKLLTRAQDYKEKTLCLLNTKSPQRFLVASKSVDIAHRLPTEGDYSSPKTQKAQQKTFTTPPTFKNLNKVKNDIPLEILEQVRLRFPQDI